MDYYCRFWYFYDFRSEHILGTAIKSNTLQPSFPRPQNTLHCTALHSGIAVDSWTHEKSVQYTSIYHTVQYRSVGSS